MNGNEYVGLECVYSWNRALCTEQKEKKKTINCETKELHFAEKDQGLWSLTAMHSPHHSPTMQTLHTCETSLTLRNEILKASRMSDVNQIIRTNNICDALARSSQKKNRQRVIGREFRRLVFLSAWACALKWTLSFRYRSSASISRIMPNNRRGDCIVPPLFNQHPNHIWISFSSRSRNAFCLFIRHLHIDIDTIWRGAATRNKKRIEQLSDSPSCIERKAYGASTLPSSTCVLCSTHRVLTSNWFY